MDKRARWGTRRWHSRAKGSRGDGGKQVDPRFVLNLVEMEGQEPLSGMSAVGVTGGRHFIYQRGVSGRGAEPVGKHQELGSGQFWR